MEVLPGGEATFSPQLVDTPGGWFPGPMDHSVSLKAICAFVEDLYDVSLVSRIINNINCFNCGSVLPIPVGPIVDD